MRENCPKTLFFLGNSMTIEFGKKIANFIVRNFVVIPEAPIQDVMRSFRPNKAPNAKNHITTCLGIPIAWYKARIPGFPRKSTREGASSLFGRGPESPQNVSCSRATQTCTGATLGLPQSKRHFWDSPGLARKDYLFLPLSIFEEIQEFGPCARQSGSQHMTSQTLLASSDVIIFEQDQKGHPQKEYP